VGAGSFKHRKVAGRPCPCTVRLKEISRRGFHKLSSVMKVVRPWHRLPREAVAAPSLALFKARLDGALSSLVWWKVSLPVAGGLGLDDL